MVVDPAQPNAAHYGPSGALCVHVRYSSTNWPWYTWYYCEYHAVSGAITYFHNNQTGGNYAGRATFWYYNNGGKMPECYYPGSAGRPHNHPYDNPKRTPPYGVTVGPR